MKRYIFRNFDSFKVHDHICHMCYNETERRDIGSKFIVYGIKNREKCAVIKSGPLHSEFLDRLAESGINIERARKNYLFNEMNLEKNHSLTSLLKMLEGLVQLNTSGRSAIVRVLIIEDETNNGRILIKESKINHLCSQNQIIMMHQYEPRNLNSDGVLGLFKSHKQIILENMIYPSPLYTNSEEGLQDLMTEPLQSCNLTVREKMILRYLVDGYTNKRISRELGISVRTVETHRNNIMNKLNARTIVDLVKLAGNNQVIW